MKVVVEEEVSGEPKRLRFLDKCRHFNGIQNTRCKAGVAYRDVTRGPGQHPCLEVVASLPGTNPLPDTCPTRSLLTHDEHVAAKAERDAGIAAFLGKLRDGKCPTCEKPIEPSQVVGSCKYASCGHRIGQVGRPPRRGSKRPP